MTEHRNALPTDYQLQEYIIRTILGHGGFGITYLAQDTQLNAQVAIKEYLPNDITVRDNDYVVQAKSQQDTDNLARGLERFLQEARILAQFKHSNIVRVLRFFQANNTAYLVMEYELGQSLASAFKKGSLTTEAALMTILPQLLDSLEKVHQAGILHRDIKPANIYLRDKDQSPVLLDFGTARYDVGHRSRSMTTIVTPGYAPCEQYDSQSNQQGAWTDIYSLGAVLYRAISGTVPADAMDRIGAILRGQPDPLKSATLVGHGRYSERFLQGIDWSLQILEKNRPQTVTQWSNAILPQSPKQSPTQPVKPIIAVSASLIIAMTLSLVAYFSYTGQKQRLIETEPLEQLREEDEEQRLEQLRLERQAQEQQAERLEQLKREQAMEEQRLEQLRLERQAQEQQAERLEQLKREQAMEEQRLEQLRLERQAQEQQAERLEQLKREQAMEEQRLEQLRLERQAREQHLAQLQQVAEPQLPPSSTTTNEIPGEYPEASTRYLTEADLINLSKQQLQIMRNEVFARHGYIFKTPSMSDYFNQQSWYQPTHNDVSSLLTEIEETNLDLIKEYEKNVIE
jgi:serine/threonine protein kinase